jgi:hypothetical protein
MKSKKSRRYSSIEWYNHYVQKSITRHTPRRYQESGAGHDSQDMALIAPIGMIFVPSVAGISHSQKSLAKQLIWRMERTYCFQTILALDMD